MKTKKHDRREFIKRSAGAIAGITAFPFIVPSSVFGRSKFIAPSDKIRIGCIGLGWQGPGNMNSFRGTRSVFSISSSTSS